EGFVPEPANSYHAHRIRLGVPEGGIDFTYGDAFPHDANMDQLGGIGQGKGCYIGQEVVSRMQHRGTARRRVVPVRSVDSLPPTGTPVEAGGRPVGMIGSAAGSQGLALLRVDRVADAKQNGLALAAGGIPIEVDLPEWVRAGPPANARA